MNWCHAAMSANRTSTPPSPPKMKMPSVVIISLRKGFLGFGFGCQFLQTRGQFHLQLGGGRGQFYAMAFAARIADDFQRGYDQLQYFGFGFVFLVHRKTLITGKVRAQDISLTFFAIAVIL